MAEARVYPEGHPEFLIHLHEIEASQANPSLSWSAPRPPVIEPAPEPQQYLSVSDARPVVPLRVPSTVRRPTPRVPVPVQGRLL